MNNVSIIGENIKKIRQHKNMSAVDLAQKADVSNATISQIENGRRQTLQADTLEKVAGALGVTTDHLLGDSDTVKFETNDIIDVLNIINYAEGITLDDIKLTDDEIQLLNISIKTTLNAIRFSRLK
ncbi:helix-turn-helix domain-containing protein [Clostridium saccharoperbutylacetonicum]|uniref:helix-turn-helix domain-containing protein n=1 Tax=Clostridium saccharoperbutylacetonicum TaxID=36745 RepID=UPI000983ADA9|nr:helix-turn-helix transcriptional regulator [Clostridium saccharoperbutylacetonicum]AQR98142.1 anaerobic benzoate catabolism transcriptional regulator [Clostridium saccharoperbutylacetonicum]NSB34035.1 transcriptional regulator with XRE-family HTH domain [Clostridium saccharoperbutylacetonicum]